VLSLAFRAADYQLSAPNWIDEARVNIHATIPAGAARQQVPEMLQRLLAERFGLVTHREARPLEVSALVVGEAGVKMREVQSPSSTRQGSAVSTGFGSSCLRTPGSVVG
jgi:uncharacterized protein (TIGR03435 family)